MMIIAPPAAQPIGFRHKTKKKKVKCGKCGKLLFEGKAVILNSANFQMHASISDIPMLVDFLARWCGSFRQMAPAINAAAAELDPAIKGKCLALVKCVEDKRFFDIFGSVVFAISVGPSSTTSELTSFLQLLSWTDRI